MKFEKTVLIAVALGAVAQAQIEESEKFMQDAFTHFLDKDKCTSVSTEIGIPAMHPEVEDGKLSEHRLNQLR